VIEAVVVKILLHYLITVLLTVLDKKREKLFPRESKLESRNDINCGFELA